jgi:hypothetical protein
MFRPIVIGGTDANSVEYNQSPNAWTSVEDFPSNDDSGYSFVHLRSAVNFNGDVYVFGMEKWYQELIAHKFDGTWTRLPQFGGNF